MPAARRRRRRAPHIEVVLSTALALAAGCHAPPAGRPSSDSSRGVERHPPVAVTAIELGTISQVLDLDFEREEGGALARARVVAAAQAIDVIEIEAVLRQSLPSAESTPVLVVGLDGQRLIAQEVDRLGLRRWYRAIVPDGRAVAGSLSVWPAAPLREAGIRVELVSLIALARSPEWAASQASAGDESNLWLTAEHESRRSRALSAGTSWSGEVVASSPADRVRIGWAALGPPRASTTLAVRLAGPRGRVEWSGVATPLFGWNQIELDTREAGQGTLQLELEAIGPVGVAFTTPAMAAPARPEDVARTLLVVLKHLPPTALGGAMPRLTHRLGSMATQVIERGSVDVAAELASMFSGDEPVRHGVGWGARVGAPGLLASRLVEQGFSTVAVADGGPLSNLTGLDQGFDRIVRYPGGWPKAAPEQLAENLALMLVDDPPPHLFAVAMLSGTWPPWLNPAGEMVGWEVTRPGPAWSLLRVFEARQGSQRREVDAGEVLKVEETYAARLDQVLEQVFRTADRAAVRLLVVVVEFGDDGEGLLALPRSMVVTAAPADPLRSSEVYLRLEQQLGLPRRGVASVSELGHASDAVDVEASRLVELLANEGRLQAVGPNGEIGWVDLWPWAGDAPRLGGVLALASEAAAAADRQLFGSRLLIAESSHGSEFILRGLGLNAEGLFAVAGAVSGVLDPMAGEARLRLGNGRQVELLIGPAAPELTLELAGLEVVLGPDAWDIEALDDGRLRVCGNAEEGRLVAAYRPDGSSP